MDPLNETVLLKTKSTLFNLLIRETSQFLCYERLLNMNYVANKNACFPRNAILVALLYSSFISSTILTISIQNSSRIPFGCKKCVFLHDTRLWFPDYRFRQIDFLKETVLAAPAQEYTDMEKLFSQIGNNTELTETHMSCLAKGELLVCRINPDQVSAEQKLGLYKVRPGLFLMLINPIAPKPTVPNGTVKS